MIQVQAITQARRKMFQDHYFYTKIQLKNKYDRITKMLKQHSSKANNDSRLKEDCNIESTKTDSPKKPKPELNPPKQIAVEGKLSLYSGETNDSKSGKQVSYTKSYAQIKDSYKHQYDVRLNLTKQDLLSKLQATENELIESKNKLVKSDCEMEDLKYLLETCNKDMSTYSTLLRNSNKALKHTASSLFSISSIYKEITNICSKRLQDEDYIKENEFSKIMDMIDDFVESKEYNTEISETCIKDNEDFLNKERTGIEQNQDEVVYYSSEQIINEESCNVDETPALQEAEDILKKAKIVTSNEVERSPEKSLGTVKFQSTIALKAKALVDRTYCKPKPIQNPLSKVCRSNEDILSSESKSVKSEKGNLLNDCFKLETIEEKDFEEKEEFSIKWNRYINIVQSALNDRKHKDVLLKAINRAFPKTIDFMKIRLNNTDMNYEHDIIDRFEKSIFKNFEHLHEIKKEYEIEIENLNKQLQDKNKEVDNIKEILNTDHALDRIKNSFDQLSSMVLSKNFTSKLDSKAIAWLRNLYGDKLYLHIKDSINNKKMKTLNKKTTRRKGKAKFNENYRNLLGEIFDTITSIVEETQHNKAQHAIECIGTNNQSQYENKQNDQSNSLKWTSHESEEGIKTYRSIVINKLETLKIKISELLNSKDLNTTLKTSKSKESLLYDSFCSSGTFMDKDCFNYETEARSHAGFNHLNQRFNTFIENKDGLKGNTYDARGKFLDEEYDEPQCLNINSDAFIKPLKFHIDDDSTLNKIKRLESEVMRLKPFEQQVTRQKYTIKTLKGMIVTSKKQPQINAFELNDMSSCLALQAKIIEELSKQQSEENEE